MSMNVEDLLRQQKQKLFGAKPPLEIGLEDLMMMRWISQDYQGFLKGFKGYLEQGRISRLIEETRASATLPLLFEVGTSKSISFQFGERSAIVRELSQNAIDSYEPQDTDRSVIFNVQNVENCTKLSVRDAGMGMDLEDIVHFFLVPYTTVKDGNPNMIGEHGVGCFSLMDHADLIQVVSRKKRNRTHAKVLLVNKDKKRTVLIGKSSSAGFEFPQPSTLGTEVTAFLRKDLKNPGQDITEETIFDLLCKYVGYVDERKARIYVGGRLINTLSKEYLTGRPVDVTIGASARPLVMSFSKRRLQPDVQDQRFESRNLNLGSTVYTQHGLFVKYGVVPFQQGAIHHDLLNSCLNLGLDFWVDLPANVSLTIGRNDVAAEHSNEVLDATYRAFESLFLESILDDRGALLYNSNPALAEGVARAFRQQYIPYVSQRLMEEYSLRVRIASCVLPAMRHAAEFLSGAAYATASAGWKAATFAAYVPYALTVGAAASAVNGGTRFFRYLKSSRSRVQAAVESFGRGLRRAAAVTAVAGLVCYGGYSVLKDVSLPSFDLPSVKGGSSTKSEVSSITITKRPAEAPAPQEVQPAASEPATPAAESRVQERRAGVESQEQAPPAPQPSREPAPPSSSGAPAAGGASPVASDAWDAPASHPGAIQDGGPIVAWVQRSDGQRIPVPAAPSPPLQPTPEGKPSGLPTMPESKASSPQPAVVVSAQPPQSPARKDATLEERVSRPQAQDSGPFKAFSGFISGVSQQVRTTIESYVGWGMETARGMAEEVASRYRQIPGWGKPYVPYAAWGFAGMLGFAGAGLAAGYSKRSIAKGLGVIGLSPLFVMYLLGQGAAAVLYESSRRWLNFVGLYTDVEVKRARKREAAFRAIQERYRSSFVKNQFVAQMLQKKIIQAVRYCRNPREPVYTQSLTRETMASLPGDPVLFSVEDLLELFIQRRLRWNGERRRDTRLDDDDMVVDARHPVVQHAVSALEPLREMVEQRYNPLVMEDHLDSLSRFSRGALDHAWLLSGGGLLHILVSELYPGISNPYRKYQWYKDVTAWAADAPGRLVEGCRTGLRDGATACSDLVTDGACVAAWLAGLTAWCGYRVVKGVTYDPLVLGFRGARWTGNHVIAPVARFAGRQTVHLVSGGISLTTRGAAAAGRGGVYAACWLGRAVVQGARRIGAVSLDDVVSACANVLPACGDAAAATAYGAWRVAAAIGGGSWYVAKATGGYAWKAGVGLLVGVPVGTARIGYQVGRAGVSGAVDLSLWALSPAFSVYERCCSWMKEVEQQQKLYAQLRAEELQRERERRQAEERRKALAVCPSKNKSLFISLTDTISALAVWAYQGTGAVGQSIGGNAMQLTRGAAGALGAVARGAGWAAVYPFYMGYKSVFGDPQEAFLYRAACSVASGLGSGVASVGGGAWWLTKKGVGVTYTVTSGCAKAGAYGIYYGGAGVVKGSWWLVKGTGCLLYNVVVFPMAFSRNALIGDYQRLWKAGQEPRCGRLNESRLETLTRHGRVGGAYVSFIAGVRRADAIVSDAIDGRLLRMGYTYIPLNGDMPEERGRQGVIGVQQSGFFSSRVLINVASADVQENICDPSKAASPEFACVLIESLLYHKARENYGSRTDDELFFAEKDRLRAQLLDYLIRNNISITDEVARALRESEVPDQQRPFIPAADVSKLCSLPPAGIWLNRDDIQHRYPPVRRRHR